MIDLKNKPLTVVFRVDSGFEIGSGHFVRCLTLARTLRDFGHSIRFVCRQHQGSLHHRAEAEGFALSILDPPYSSSKVKYKEGLTHGSFLGVDQVDDLNDVLALDSVKIADIIVVDHYGIDEDWEVAFSKQKDKLVVVMDDLADRAHSCSILIDQNYYSDMKTRYTGKVGREAMLLLGPEFAIIRPQFKDFSKRNGSASREPLVPLNILISFGGSDKSGYGLMISRCILGSPLGSFVRCKLMGEYSSLDQKEKLLELAKRFPHSFEYLGFSEAPWECMSDAELYIGAGGSTTWERCCMGLSAIVFSISKNQEKMSQEFADAGYQIYLGSIESMVEGKLIAAIKDVLEHSELRLRFRNCSQSLVDGGGASRVAETIIASAKIFR